MTSIDVPRNTSQRVGKSFVLSKRVVSQSNGVYTVPAGKTARITKMQFIIDSFGSASRAGVGFLDSSNGNALVSISIQIVLAAPNSVSFPYQGNDVTLDEGDKLTSWQSSGTNAGIDITVTIEEFSK